MLLFDFVKIPKTQATGAYMKQALVNFTEGNRDLCKYKTKKHNNSGIHNVTNIKTYCK